MTTQEEKFCTKLAECIKEFRKVQCETRGNDDEIAYFFNKELKAWIIKNKKCISILSTLNFEKAAMTFFIRNIINPVRKDD